MSILGGLQPQPPFSQWPRRTIAVNMNIPTAASLNSSSTGCQHGPLSQAGGRKRRGIDFARAGCNCRVRLCPLPPAALEKLCAALSQWGLDPGCGPVQV